MSPRRSSRARKAVVPLYKTPDNRSETNIRRSSSSKKRKSIEESPTHDEEDEDIHSQPSESEEEEVVVQRAPKRRKAKASALSQLKLKDKDSLLASLLEAKDEDTMQTLARQVTKSSDTLQMLKLVFESLGGTLATTTQVELWTDEDWQEHIQQLVQDMTDSPWVLLSANKQRSAAAKEFLALYNSFWTLVTTTALSGQDRFGVEQVKEFLQAIMELTSVNQPDVRWSATVAVYRIIDGLLEHAQVLQEKTTKANRQLQAAQKAKQKVKTQSLQKNLQQWKRMIDEIRHLAQDAVVTVVLKRYRDVHPGIRVESLTSLTNFIVLAPQTFGQSSFVKYIAWMWNDKEASVRQAALQGILVLLEKVNADLFRAVLDKFVNRLAECVQDIDTTNQEIALKCLLVMVRQDLLDPPEDVWTSINLRALASDATPQARQTALYFVLEQLEAFDSDQVTVVLDAERVVELVDWIAHHLKTDESVQFVVESLLGMPQHERLVRTWPHYVKALELQHQRESKSTQSLRVLVNMLVQAARLEAESPSKSKKYPDSRPDFTRTLLSCLPDLLSRYKNDVQVQRCLSELPRYFVSSVWHVSSRKKSVLELANKLSQVFLETVDRTVMVNSIEALQSLAKGPRATDLLTKLQSLAVQVHETVLEILMEEDPKDMDKQHAILLALRRLTALAKRTDIGPLLSEEDPEGRLENLCGEISKTIGHQLSIREITEGKVPGIWEETESEAHQIWSSAVHEVFEFWLAATAWRVSNVVKNLEKASAESVEFLQRLRDGLAKMLIFCYDQFVDPDEGDYSDDHVAFAESVQKHAGDAAGALRTLFPKVWVDSDHSVLQSLAMTDDGHVIGGYVRFVRLKDSEMEQAGEEDEQEKSEAMSKLLLPIVRAVAPNWHQGVRREAAVVLSHIAGSSLSCRELAVMFSGMLQKIEPVRLLEAHMTCLCEDFDHWTNSEPELLENERPTEEEMEAFEEAEKQHATQFATLEERAKRLSTTLGSTKIKDASIASSILGFAREGIRFAFSTSIRGQSQEELPLGARLPFLKVVGKYMTWIRRNKSHVAAIRNEFNQAEKELRAHHEYGEVFDNDKRTIEEFRKTGDLGPYPGNDDDSIQSADEASFSVASRSSRNARRLSSMSGLSSIRSKTSTKGSLSPLHEEDSGHDNDEDDDVESTGMASSIVTSPGK